MRSLRVEKMQRRCVCVAILILITCVSACCADTVVDDWVLDFNYQLFVGTDSLASDGYDPLDVPKSGSYRPGYVGTYHETGADGWSGSTGFYNVDMRAPLELVPGCSKTWRLYLWADPAYTGNEIGLAWSNGVSDSVFQCVQFRLTYVRAAIGYWDHREGMSILLNDTHEGLWYFPTYRTDNGLDGYVFDLTATVIPEPSALAALLCGLGGVLLRRRR